MIEHLYPLTSTSGVCPECGANLTKGNTCQSIFETFLALEYTNPLYGQVHFLTVACFMIQHGRYSDEALRSIEKQLCDYFEGSASTQQMVKTMECEMSQAKRRWKVTRQPHALPQIKVPWSMTIADVTSRHHDARGYCILVEQWARTTLQEMKPLISQKPPV